MSEQIRNGLTIPGGRYSGRGDFRYHCVCVCMGNFILSVCVSACSQLLTRAIMRD